MTKNEFLLRFARECLQHVNRGAVREMMLDSEWIKDEVLYHYGICGSLMIEERNTLGEEEAEELLNEREDEYLCLTDTIRKDLDNLLKGLTKSEGQQRPAKDQ